MNNDIREILLNKVRHLNMMAESLGIPDDIFRKYGASGFAYSIFVLGNGPTPEVICGNSSGSDESNEDEIYDESQKLTSSKNNKYQKDFDLLCQSVPHIDREVLINLGISYAALSMELEPFKYDKSDKGTPEMLEAISLVEGSVMGMIKAGANATTKAKKTLSKGGNDARHAENRAMKLSVFAWLDVNMSRCKSMDAAAREIAENVVPVVSGTARDWVGEWKKKQTVLTWLGANMSSSKSKDAVASEIVEKVVTVKLSIARDWVDEWTELGCPGRA